MGLNVIEEGISEDVLNRIGSKIGQSPSTTIVGVVTVRILFIKLSN